ncbi:hypothetical protein DVH05_014373 [Phytophthora capsici]|nr:hypothetical protein DVH05_014373 [Phytophthora capsici]
MPVAAAARRRTIRQAKIPSINRTWKTTAATKTALICHQMDAPLMPSAPAAVSNLLAVDRKLV